MINQIFILKKKKAEKQDCSITSPVTVFQQIVRLSLAQVSKYELSLGHHDIPITPGVTRDES